MDILGWIHECGVALPARLPWVFALFLAGLGGSVTHCSTMCSGFVLGQTSAMPGQGWVARLLLPFHAGRAVTYAALGGVAGFSFHFLAGWPPFAVLRHLMLAIVAVIFLAVFADRFLRKAGVALPTLSILKPRCALAAMGRVGRTHSVAGRFGLGLALGFLPCPLVYAALLASAAHASPVAGAAGMFAFALGTAPALMGLGVVGAKMLDGHPRLRDGLTLTVLGINGVVLLAIAAS